MAVVPFSSLTFSEASSYFIPHPCNYGDLRVKALLRFHWTSGGGISNVASYL
jgi:hypothetical protein